MIIVLWFRTVIVLRPVKAGGKEGVNITPAPGRVPGVTLATEKSLTSDKNLVKIQMIENLNNNEGIRIISSHTSLIIKLLRMAQDT